MNSAITLADQLAAFLRRYPRVVILTGAGISAASGIPTYRDGDGKWLHHKPIQHGDFVSDEFTRRRYWARSLRGWPHVRDAAPNPAHRALAQLEENERVELLITQNVDRLHQRAGHRKVIDLHGRLDRVRCLQCNNLEERETIQQWLLAHNNAPGTTGQQIKPDGDSDVADAQLERFRVPPCPACDAVLIPDVVFFGGSVPAARVESCRTALERADALLVIGSSLQVYSGYRFCRQAKEAGKPIALINPGVTRADPIAALKIDADAVSVLSRLASRLRAA
ncbi:NAD-dependent protein deacetylase [Seongchinamella sediminis]|uniref:protein acetyllysine N-acetyltransferase n=1 Tax=Seongchinamella sediminis TaxID=2283635 RepID=A0A3L7DZQ6_9GAMM|nr:NAD-dependent protein deacetylase [Seongchinamella sediminis]RLQ23077.1 NAD-dependent protein deacetylase [Seongchinamella sediminis]